MSALSAPVLPPRPFLDAVVARVAFLWSFLHVAVGSASDADFPQALAWHPVVSLVAAGVIVFAVFIEMRRLRELTFLANLGHSFSKVAILVAAMSLLLDVALGLIVG